MSLFADKRTSFLDRRPFAPDIFNRSVLGEWWLGRQSSFTDKSDTICSKMRLRNSNGPSRPVPGFYDHFDFVFHSYDPFNAQGWHELTDSNRRTNGGRGTEYVIPIKIESSSSTQEHTSQPSSRDFGLEIPIVMGNCEKDTVKSAKSSKPADSPAPVYTPTTDVNRGCRDGTSDEVLDVEAFFSNSRHSPQLDRKTHRNHTFSDIDLDIDDDSENARTGSRNELQTQSGFEVSSQTKTSEALSTAETCEREGAEGNEKHDSQQSTCTCPGRTDIVSTPSYPIYDYLKPRLAAEDRQVDYVRGDGNCLFRALSKDLYGTEQFHTEIRQAVCDLIQSHSETFRQYMDRGDVSLHLADMRTPGTWATSCEIYAAATLLQRPIYMLAPSPVCDTDYHWLLFSPQSLTGGDRIAESDINKNRDSGQACYLTLCHTNANHYDRVAPITAVCNCQLPPPCLTGVTMSVDLTAED